MKRILVAFTCLLLLTSLAQITSFSKTEITNDVSLEIVSTEEALIAINNFIGWEVQPKGGNQGEKQKFTGVLPIKNNTNQIIEVFDIHTPYVGNLVVKSERVSLSPGEEKQIQLHIEVDVDKSNKEEKRKGNDPIEINIVVQANNGFNAAIKHQLPTINKAPPKSNNGNGNNEKDNKSKSEQESEAGELEQEENEIGVAEDLDQEVTNN